MSYTLDKPPSKSATSFRGGGAAIGLRVLAVGMEPPASGEGGFSLPPRSIPVISLINAAANFSFDGDEMPSESSSDQLICEPLQETDMMSRLSGYFEALRSRKDLFIAQEATEIQRSKLGQADPVFLKVLPFPVETCTLDDLIKFHALQNLNGDESYESMGPEDNADLILWIMKDFIFRLWGLHYSGVTHGNLRPQNVLIVDGECVLESTLNDDFKSLEWNAPEQFSCSTTTKASDMFAFGCILYFCITKGSHPFGDPEQRILNILANQPNISGVEQYPEAYYLISRLLDPDPEMRPKAHESFGFPFFMNERTKLELMDYVWRDALLSEELENEITSRIPMFKDENWRSRFLEFISEYSFSHEQPFSNYKDLFGQRGSHSFFPSIFMEMMDAAIKVGVLKKYACFLYDDDRRLLDTDYPHVLKNGFRCSFFFDIFGPWW